MPPLRILRMSQRTASRTTRSPSRFLLGLLLLASMLRALVPMGYMPDMQALREGRLALAFCAAAGPPMAPRAPAALPENPSHTGHRHMAGMAAMAQDSVAQGHGAHDHGSGAAGQECPFGLIAHQALDIPVAPAVVAMPLAGDAEPPPFAGRAAPPMPAAGPPLGQRAPPLALG